MRILTSNGRFILKCCKPFKFLVLGQFIISFIWAIDVSLRPYLLKIMLDRLPTLKMGTAADALMVPAGIYLLMALVVVGMYRVYDYLWLKLNPPLKRHIAKILITRMMLHSQKLFQDHFAGTLANKIKDVMSGVPDFFKILDVFVRHFIALLFAILTLWSVHRQFAINLCAWVAIFVIGSLFFSKRAKLLSQLASEVKSSVMGSIVDIFSNITSIRLFARRTYEIDKLSPLLNAYVAADQKRDWYFLKMFSFQGITFVIYQGASLYWLIHGFNKGFITVGDFALILTINISIVDFLWSLSIDMGKFAELVGNISQGLTIALSPLQITDQSNAAKLQVTKGTIVFENVTFDYNNSAPVFNNLSVVLKGGEKVGLVGYSGGGKTTFVNLILRLHDVQRGRILIDGHNIKEVTQDSLHEAIAMIPQDPSLFHRSLFENIEYGDVSAQKEDIYLAAKKAHAHQFIESFPKGYDTLVGERGIKLSGGQRQRIAIARAILKDAPILILDEATSQLDSITEKLIQESLLNLIHHKTTLVIAHRLSTLLHMDRILVFDQGIIIQDGSHKTLIEQQGLYKTLWKTQVGGFIIDSKSTEA